MESIEIESTLKKLKDVINLAHNDNVQMINEALHIEEQLPEEAQ